MKKIRTKAKKPSLKQEIKNELMGITSLTLGIFIGFCLWQGNDNNNFSTIGAIGSFIYITLTVLLGSGKVIFPFVFVILGFGKLWFRMNWDKFTILSWLSMVVSILAILHLRLPIELQTIASGLEGNGGGALGAIAARISLTLFGRIGAYIILSALSLVAFLGIFRKSLTELFKQISSYLGQFLRRVREELADFIFEKIEEDEKAKRNKKIKVMNGNDKVDSPVPVIIDHIDNIDKESVKDNISAPALVKGHLRLVKDNREVEKQFTEEVTCPPLPKLENFQMPPLELLQFPNKIKSQRLNKDITDKVRILEETLENFGVKAKVTQVSRGPSVTRYEIQPPPGIKVSRIVNLADDIALSLAAPQVRIEAPIPGKAAVGVEVPNEEIAAVTLREVLETSLFQESESKLTIALGKDIAGNPIVADLGKMPHLLIAGATGSGKSVCMNAVIASVLYKARPEEVKLLMIDPKVVELSNFNGIPHLISPVVTDAKKAATSLRWAVHEMENRYELFAATGVKDISRYNQVKKEEDPSGSFPLLPYIIVLIDELADLMMVAPADVEDAICRLAQMARAAGIHLVVATQRPSVDVITGVIKANIPSRIAFAVSSQTDSRTILDMGGAERLLGRGDMLFYPTGMAKPLRIQGVYVSDREIDALVVFLKKQKEPQYITPWQNIEEETPDIIEEDELLGDAARIFIESGQASISLLQRRLRIGYTRAARIIDQLESKGIVGGYEGSKPRAIRMTWEEYEKTFSNNS